ncbi:outer membrane beta-barrel protein [Chryseobacterium sp. JV558]|uniref:outer membrane beta-barrel protein n=1 Tax=Chryseobacterium sp. JV558 TaxID=2663236 RepID=UPI00299D0413|nr:outer membrane beta-barrel protein [Chryseobacterium sp. JV558]MDW9378978.1 outer membrane beta-barrel protein [Chryseobacterium sp. JV558]
MKKIALMGAVALFGLSNAQIAKGTSYLSGQVGYFHNESHESAFKRKDDIIRILPTAGYFVTTNLAVGLGIGYKSAVTKNNIGNDSVGNVVQTKDTDNAFVVVPFVRKYWTLSDKLFVFGQLQVPVEFGKEKLDANSYIYSGDPFLDPSSSRKNSYTNVGVNIRPGLDYFISKNWSVEATIGEFGYNSYKRDIDGARRAGDYKVGISLASVTLGVKYVFVKNK